MLDEKLLKILEKSDYETQRGILVCKNAGLILQINYLRKRYIFSPKPFIKDYSTFPYLADNQLKKELFELAKFFDVSMRFVETVFYYQSIPFYVFGVLSMRVESYVDENTQMKTGFYIYVESKTTISTLKNAFRYIKSEIQEMSQFINDRKVIPSPTKRRRKINPFDEKITSYLVFQEKLLLETGKNKKLLSPNDLITDATIETEEDKNMRAFLMDISSEKGFDRVRHNYYDVMSFYNIPTYTEYFHFHINHI